MGNERLPPGAGRDLDPTRASCDLDECRAALARLRGRLSSVEREQQEAFAACAALEAQVAEVGNLYIAMERLHGGTDRAEVLDAIQDIVINIIGSEELAVFELREGDRELRVARSFGVDEARLAPVPLGSGAIGRAAAERRPWIAGDGAGPPDPSHLTACVPLELNGRVMGVLAVWRLLGHKPALCDADRKVLDLLGRHAGPALYLTSLPRPPRAG
jgi:hypothetical protein